MAYRFSLLAPGQNPRRSKYQRRYIMPVIAAVVKCKKCGFEVRSDWKFCPNCGDKIVCTGKYEACAKK